MSLRDLQHALALLIRLPESHRGEKLETFLDQFALSEKERRQLVALGSEYRVAKFGRAMRGVRFEDSQGDSLSMCRMYLRPSDLEEYYFKHFDGAHPTDRIDAFPLIFIEDLATNPAARDFFQEKVPPFFWDIARFDLALARAREGQFQNKVNLPQGSLLSHARFELLMMDWDIAALADHLKDLPKDRLADPPLRRPVVMLIMEHNQLPGYRMFEINDEVAQFLTAQRDQPASGTEDPATEWFPSLVKLGLCHSGKAN